MAERLETLRGWLGVQAGTQVLWFKDFESQALLTVTTDNPGQLAAEHYKHRIVLTGLVSRDDRTGRPHAIRNISRVVVDPGEYQPGRVR